VHEEKELSLARFTAQLAETRALLGAHLGLYQIHSATAESGCLEDTSLLRALVEGRRAGAYRAVGLTLSGPTSARALEQARAARADGEPVFDVVQATFNCLEPSLAAPLAAAHDAGLGVIVKEALANGRLTPANTRPEDASLLGALGETAGRLGCGIDQLALAFVLAQPFVDVVLSGAATTAQLASHLKRPARWPPSPSPRPATGGGAARSAGAERRRETPHRRPLVAAEAPRCRHGTAGPRRGGLRAARRRRHRAPRRRARSIRRRAPRTDHLDRGSASRVPRREAHPNEDGIWCRRSGC